MLKKTFKGGIHPPYFKEFTNKNQIRKLEVPGEVIIPVIQHTGIAALPITKIGDHVRQGTLIARQTGPISCNIHSSISGKVRAIKKAPHPIIGICDSIVVESDGREEIEPLAQPLRVAIEDLNPDDIKGIIQQAGIVGLGGAAFPTHIKLNPPKDKRVDTFILNGVECEPYLTCDERVMIESPKDILQGTLLIMKAAGVAKGFVAIEDNKPEAITVMQTALNELRFTDYDLQITVVRTKYPQGGEKQLIKTLLNREVPEAGLPFDVSCLVDNVQTALAVYEAVYKKKPLYERVITVTGDAIKTPSNLLVRLGTKISYIIEKCGGLTRPLAKAIMGGPLMGIAQYTLDVPVIKGTSGIIFLSKDKIDRFTEDTCIRCGRCIEICPMGLIPTTIMQFVKNGMFKEVKALGIANCFECGACTYDCPAKIQLLDYVKFGKSKI